jgi:DNA-binding IclR family transcriptional regulator
MKRRSNDAEERPASGTQAVLRAIAVLKAFGGARSAWGLTELAAELGLHKTTVFRLLGALVDEGFVERDAEHQTYRLGPALIGLGTRAGRATGLHAAAHPVLGALADDTGETATLEVLAGSEVLILDEVAGRFLLGSAPEIGTRWPAYATSTGKVLLAAARFAPDAHAAPAALGRLVRLGPGTITSHARLDRELAAVWRRGFAIASEELERGYVAIGAPVRDARGRVVAAISVGGPKTRLTRTRTAQLAALVRHAADRVSYRLGAPDLADPADRAVRSTGSASSASSASSTTPTAAPTRRAAFAPARRSRS